MSRQDNPISERSSTSRIIYVLTERATKRQYVGVTKRVLRERINAHLTQARRARPVRPNGLMAALRRMLAAGKTFDECFNAQVVDAAATDAEARLKERNWIAILACRQPDGFNKLPGGSSLGGPANARPVTVEISGTKVTYPSFSDALSARNNALRSAGEPVIEASVAYARWAAGWPLEEVLGYQPHEDGRSVRRLFRCNGQAFTSLRAASAATGLGIETLRSRLHRSRAAPGEVPDIGEDRRDHGVGRAALNELRIPWPGTKEILTAAEFGRRTGVAKATIIHRWARLRSESARRVRPLTRRGIHRRLTAPPTERRKLLSLTLPDGRRWTGGERELARRVLRDYAVEASRVERLSEPGIRARLRALTRKQRKDPVFVAQAFGFTLGDVGVPDRPSCG